LENRRPDEGVVRAVASLPFCNACVLFPSQTIGSSQSVNHRTSVLVAAMLRCVSAVQFNDTK
jgi:hypothetical protein